MCYNVEERIFSMITKRKFWAIYAAFLSLMHLCLFGIFYLADYLPSIKLLEMSDAVYAILSYLSALIDFCLPIITAVVIFSIVKRSFKRAAIFSALLALTRIFYTFPYRYILFVTDTTYGFDSVDSVLQSTYVTLFGVFILWLRVLIFYFLIYYVTRHLTAKRMKCEMPAYKQKALTPKDKKKLLAKAADALDEELLQNSYFDLKEPVIAGIFSVAFLQFIISLIEEIVNAVIFIVQYKGFYSTGEILLMEFSFIFILIELIAAHLFSLVAKRLARKAVDRVVWEDDDEDDEEIII